MRQTTNLVSNLLSTVLAAVLVFTACPIGAFGMDLFHADSGAASNTPDDAGMRNGATMIRTLSAKANKNTADEKTSADGTKANAARSSKKGAADKRIPIYNIKSASYPYAREVMHHVDLAKKWGAKAAKGNVTCIWAYRQALAAIHFDTLLREIEKSQNSANAQGMKDTNPAGYAIDEQIVYLRFDISHKEQSASVVFDKSGEVIDVSTTGGDAFNCWDFHDGTLLSHTGGFSNGDVKEPKVMGTWDEDERLSAQKELLDEVYEQRDLLQVDSMIDV